MQTIVLLDGRLIRGFEAPVALYGSSCMDTQSVRTPVFRWVPVDTPLNPGLSFYGTIPKKKDLKLTLGIGIDF